MAIITLDALLQRVCTNIQAVDTAGAPNYTFWTQAAITRWLNDAIVRVCAEVPIRQYVTFERALTPVLYTNPYAEYIPKLGQDIDQLGAIQWDTYKLYRKSIDWLEEAYTDWDTLQGTPTWFAFNDFAPGVIKIVPDPGRDPVAMRGIATIKPTLMVSGSSCPPFDSEFHTLCEHWATHRAWRMSSETEDRAKAQDALLDFGADLAKYKAKQARGFNLTALTIPAPYL